MKQKDIIFILGSSFFVIFAWIVFNIYHGSVQSTIPEKTIRKITPIKAEFDLKTVENIKGRNKIEPLYNITSEPSSPSTTPSAIPTPTIGQQTEEGQASAGGALSL